METFENMSRFSRINDENEYEEFVSESFLKTEEIFYL